MQPLTLSIAHLSIAFLPVVIVLWLMWCGQYPLKKPLLALARMLLQLLLVGYFLVYLFAQTSASLVLLLLIIMMLTASWLALNVSEQCSWRLYLLSLTALCIGGGSVLLIITQGVLQITPWYQPKVIIPLAGMIFSSAMTGISIALERFVAERKNYTEPTIEKNSYCSQQAFKAAMIPVINTMLAVGIVALPGMMTGQILSGVAPYIAARYQIMVMCMIFSATGLSVYLFLMLYSRIVLKNNTAEKI